MDITRTRNEAWVSQFTFFSAILRARSCFFSVHKPSIDPCAAHHASQKCLLGECGGSQVEITRNESMSGSVHFLWKPRRGVAPIFFYPENPRWVGVRIMHLKNGRWARVVVPLQKKKASIGPCAAHHSCIPKMAVVCVLWFHCSNWMDITRNESLNVSIHFLCKPWGSFVLPFQKWLLGECCGCKIGGGESVTRKIRQENTIANRYGLLKCKTISYLYKTWINDGVRS
jgi:hypothetical protein